MPLVPRLVAIGVLSVAFVTLTIAITAGAFTGLDLQVAQAMHDAWAPPLHPLFQLVAELGSIELTTILMLALTVYLWRAGFEGCSHRSRCGRTCSFPCAKISRSRNR